MIGTRKRWILTVSPSMKDVKRGVWIQQIFTDEESVYELFEKFTAMGLYCCIETEEVRPILSGFSHNEFRDYWK